MEKNQETLVGHMNVNQIPGAECILHPTTKVKGVFIPVENNPGISIWDPEGDKSKRQIKLWMKIIKKKETDKSGHTHFVKLHINKQTAEMYGMDQAAERKAAVIFGNLKSFTNEERTATPGYQAAPPAYQQMPDDDMPPSYPEPVHALSADF